LSFSDLMSLVVRIVDAERNVEWINAWMKGW
jgi:hypothetical protein